MKIRSFILIVLLVGAFVYLTSYSNFHGIPNAPLAKLWRESPMQLTEADAQPAYTQMQLLTSISRWAKCSPSWITSGSPTTPSWYSPVTTVPPSGGGSAAGGFRPAKASPVAMKDGQHPHTHGLAGHSDGA